MMAAVTAVMHGSLAGLADGPVTVSASTRDQAGHQSSASHTDKLESTHQATSGAAGLPPGSETHEGSITQGNAHGATGVPVMGEKEEALPGV